MQMGNVMNKYKVEKKEEIMEKNVLSFKNKAIPLKPYSDLKIKDKILKKQMKMEYEPAFKKRNKVLLKSDIPVIQPSQKNTSSAMERAPIPQKAILKSQLNKEKPQIPKINTPSINKIPLKNNNLIQDSNIKSNITEDDFDYDEYEDYDDTKEMLEEIEDNKFKLKIDISNANKPKKSKVSSFKKNMIKEIKTKIKESPQERIMKLEKQVLVYNKKQVKEKKQIGEGGFGVVVKGKMKKLDVAIKKFNLYSSDDFIKEVSIVKLIKHNNIPSFYGLIKEENTHLNEINSHSNNITETKYSIITELIKGVTLDIFMNYIGHDWFLKIVLFVDLATVLTHLHSLKLIHRDLKPSNVMVDREIKLKLLDFGISKISKSTFTDTITTGTLLYMAPENFNLNLSKTKNDDTSSKISNKVDVWAFGCMLAEAFTNNKPWAPYIEEDNKVVSMLFHKQEFLFDESKIEFPEIIEIIKECTVIDSSLRSNMIDIKNKLILFLHSQFKISNTSCMFGGLSRFSSEIKYKTLRKVQDYLFQEYNILKFKYFKASVNAIKNKEKDELNSTLLSFIRANNVKRADILDEYEHDDSSIINKNLPNIKQENKRVSLESKQSKESKESYDTNPSTKEFLYNNENKTSNNVNTYEFSNNKTMNYSKNNDSNITYTLNTNTCTSYIKSFILNYKDYEINPLNKKTEEFDINNTPHNKNTDKRSATLEEEELLSLFKNKIGEFSEKFAS